MLHLFTVPFWNYHFKWSPESLGTFHGVLLLITRAVLFRRWTYFEAACMCQCGTPFKVSKSRVKERWWWATDCTFLVPQPPRGWRPPYVNSLFVSHAHYAWAMCVSEWRGYPNSWIYSMIVDLNLPVYCISTWHHCHNLSWWLGDW